jgi:hypothetical protein
MLYQPAFLIGRRRVGRGEQSPGRRGGVLEAVKLRQVLEVTMESREQLS